MFALGWATALTHYGLREKQVLHAVSLPQAFCAASSPQYLHVSSWKESVIQWKQSLVRIYIEDRYFLVSTRVSLIFWIIFLFKKENKKNMKHLFFFFIGFWHWWLLNVYSTVMTINLTTNSMTWRRRNKTGCCCHGAAVFSVSRAASQAASWAANCTRFFIAIKHAALL